MPPVYTGTRYQTKLPVLEANVQMLSALHRRLIGVDTLQQSPAPHSNERVGEDCLTVDDFDVIAENVRAILSTRFTSMDPTKMERIIQEHKRRRMLSHGLIADI